MEGQWLEKESTSQEEALTVLKDLKQRPFFLRGSFPPVKERSADVKNPTDLNNKNRGGGVREFGPWKGSGMTTAEYSPFQNPQ